MSPQFLQVLMLLRRDLGGDRAETGRDPSKGPLHDVRHGQAPGAGSGVTFLLSSCPTPREKKDIVEIRTYVVFLGIVMLRFHGVASQLLRSCLSIVRSGSPRLLNAPTWVGGLSRSLFQYLEPPRQFVMPHKCEWRYPAF